MMKWRPLFRRLHLIAGLAVGLVAAAVGLSGSALTFREEIERALYRPRVAPQAVSASLQTSYAKALAIEPERRRVSIIILPEKAEAPLEFALSRRGARNLKEADQLSLYANPFTGEIIGQRRRNESFIAWLRDLHFALFAGVTGLKINGWMALALVFISLTGLALWFQTKSRGKVFAVNWSASWKRVTWDLHRLLGIVVALGLIVVAATGAYYPFRETVQKWLANAGPLPPRGSPAVAPQADKQPLDADVILEKARSVMADARLAALRPPATPTQAWAATFHRRGESGESVDSGPTAYLDPYTGALLRLDDARAMSLVGKILKTIEPLHFGKLGGAPHKLLWCLLGLTPSLLLLSGVLMWRNRVGGKKS
jgi:uncharacterized iron-regulated membrane protein